MIELLSPAGDLERLKVAFEYGADAVYVGGKVMSMRAKARNFSEAEMETGIKYAHEIGKKVYVAVNICAHNSDFTGLDEYLNWLEKIGADAVLVSDPGVFMLAKNTTLDIHISTQANVTNYASAAFWRDLGARRFVAARELSLGEIKEISERAPNIEIEAFVHGAMCMAYSGRCLISNFLNERDANRGECSQPCRFNYAFHEGVCVEEKTGETFPVYENERGTYIFNSKDLCMIGHIDDLIGAGVRSLKIEGRMKTEYYVGAVTKIYREALNDFAESPTLYKSKIPHYKSELEKVGNRGYTTGFFYGKMSGTDHDYIGENQATSQNFTAMIESYDPNTKMCLIEQRNKFQKGDTVEILRAKAPNFTQTVENMHDEDGAEITSAPHPKQKIYLKVNEPVAKYDMIRRG
ncbi:MAG: U32 family peptidase [Defluviitaleaceae bacterium]|nr:U32 family peptidase [Defluviitaleaceae bacterium]MCL2264034.1 U32 family peptidase [Defluviitaleaceae bacterium]